MIITHGNITYFVLIDLQGLQYHSEDSSQGWRWSTVTTLKGQDCIEKILTNLQKTSTRGSRSIKVEGDQRHSRELITMRTLEDLPTLCPEAAPW